MSTNFRGTEEGTLLWRPSQNHIEQAGLTRFMQWLADHKNLTFDSYEQLRSWSVEHIEAFWESVWQYFDIQAYSTYQTVLKERQMPGAEWFPGAQLNFADQLFRYRDTPIPAILARTETSELREISREQLYRQTAALTSSLRELGVKKGDCVAAYITNIPEAIIAMLATASIGAVWSGCSPDFGTESVVERFGQIKPKILISVDGYHYGGKAHDSTGHLARLQQQLPDLQYTILVPQLSEHPDLTELPERAHTIPWHNLISRDAGELVTEPVPFDHPLWVLYSSGTTGKPKPIVHGHGGMLLEHLKYMSFHADVKPGDRFFWYTTTGWMMWNVVVGAMLQGATAVLYDGHPGYPDLNTLWRFAEETEMSTFGTSAPYLVTCMKESLTPRNTFDLSSLKSIGSTGAPLPPEGYEWVYRNVGDDIMLNSTSGGTDICSSFVGGNPILPVHAGEIQCRTLGAAVQAYNEQGEPVTDEVGEMVITQPMPCMPLYFWGDDNYSRYKESYFEMFPGVWRHGDWLKVTSRGSCIIYGRSDATLNRMGLRIGTSEIYRAVDTEPRVNDSLTVSLQLEDGSWYMPLFIKPKEGEELDEQLQQSVRQKIREQVSPKFIPDEIIQVADIPYTLNGKKMEKPVKRIMEGANAEDVVSQDSMQNPEALEFFREFAGRRNGSH